MKEKPTAQQLLERQCRVQEMIERSDPAIERALIFGRVNQYYLTGTYQDAVLLMDFASQKTRLFVRKSVERAAQECPLDIVEPMRSYRDLLAWLPAQAGIVGIDVEQLPLVRFLNLKKYFTFSEIRPVDKMIYAVRAIKEDFEINLIKEAGKRQHELLETVVPRLLQTGISEAALMVEIYRAMIDLGHQGVTRFGSSQGSYAIGQIGFGTNSLYPTFFDGPGGMRGLSAAVPDSGSRERLLQEGDAVYLDFCFGLGGYHSDKTRVYSFGATPPEHAQSIQRACLEMLDEIAAKLRPGAIPQEIYRQAVDNRPAILKDHFMGFKDDTVRFLGHGIGLNADEPPVIANGFAEPLQTGMVLAIEPKCGVPDYGMVGVEESFLITDEGAVCLTGGAGPIRVVL